MQSSQCLNCGTPRPVGPSAPCSVCNLKPAEAVAAMGSEEWMVAYKQILEEQRKTAPSPKDVLLACDDRMLLHRSSLQPFLERPERLNAVMTRLNASGIMQKCRLVDCRPATDSELETVHSSALIRSLSEASQQLAGHNNGTAAGGAEARQQPANAASGSNIEESFSALSGVLNPDTLFNVHTELAARLAAGAAIDVATAVASGRARAGVAVVRPPGAQCTSHC